MHINLPDFIARTFPARLRHVLGNSHFLLALEMGVGLLRAVSGTRTKSRMRIRRKREAPGGVFWVGSDTPCCKCCWCCCCCCLLLTAALLHLLLYLVVPLLLRLMHLSLCLLASLS